MEIIVAMLIMSLVVAGLFGLFVTSHKFIIEAGHRLQAINYARQVAETLKVHVIAEPSPITGIGPPLSTVTPHNPSSSTPNDLGLPSDFITGITGETCTYTVSPNPQGTIDLKQVTITTTWTEP